MDTAADVPEAELVEPEAARFADPAAALEPGELLADAASPSSRAPYIMAQHSYKCLEVAGESTANTANIRQWECQGHANQRWRLQYAGGGYFYIVAQHSGKCAEVARGSRFNGASVRQGECRGSIHQRWRLQYAGGGYFYIVSQRSGKCAEVAWGGIANGTDVWQWECDGDSNQLWLIQW